MKKPLMENVTCKTCGRVFQITNGGILRACSVECAIPRSQEESARLIGILDGICSEILKNTKH